VEVTKFTGDMNTDRLSKVCKRGNRYSFPRCKPKR
jgi:hypothetical protein